MNSWTSPVDIRPDHLAIVQEILRVHLPAGFQVWVFGSRANWTTKDSSDLDLAVEGAAKLDHKAMVGLEVAFEESNLPYTVDVVDLKAVSSNFKQIVEDQRVLLTAAGSGANVHGEWREGTLGGVIEFKRGYDLPQRDRIPGSVPLVSSSGVTDFHAEAKVKGPGVVTGRYGTLGEVFFIQEDFWPLNTALYVRDFKGNDPRFISYFLRSLDFSAYSDKAAVPGLNRNHLHEATVCYPTDIGQQRAIAHVLGTLDDKIELNRRMNQTLEEMARAIFQDWFVDFGPTRAKKEGLDPYLPPELWDLFPEHIVDSELGEIPEGWEWKTVKDCFDLTMGQSPPGSTYNDHGDGLPFFQGSTDFGARFPANRRFCSAPARTAQRDDTLISVRAPIGDMNMAWERCCIGRGVAALRHKSGASSFTYHSSQSMKPEIQVYEQTGTVFGAITKKQFESVPFLDPQGQLLERFEALVQPLDQRIRSNTDAIASITAQRDALLPKLMSGELKPQEREY